MKFIAPLYPFALLATLTACTQKPETTPQAELVQAHSQTISGLDLSGRDTGIRPQDDLFHYMNGGWLAETAIPADKSSWGTFDILRETTLNQLKVLIEARLDNAKEHNERLVADLYRDLLAANETAQAGPGPLTEDLAAIAAITDHGQLPPLFARLARLGVTAPLAPWIGQDRGDSRRYAVYLSQSGLGLPDRDYYFDDSDQGQALLTGYREYLATLMTLAGFGDHPEEVDARVEAVLEVERRLAEHHWSRVANRDAEKTYNPTAKIALLSELPPPWRQFFEDLNMAGQERYIVRQPDYIAALGDVVEESSLPAWQDYMRLHLLNAYAPYLGSDFDRARFDFYGRQLRGTEEQEPQWQRAVNYMNGAVGDALGQLYVEEHFPPQAKARMEEMVANLMAAFEESITNLPWMSASTREQALEKLAAFNTKIGYPERWRDYSALEIRAGDLIGNVRRINQWRHQRDVARLNQPVDRDEWFLPPQIVNAYYSPGMNEIVLPAAILQPPFFNMAADDAVNYGAIGGVIGHEIGHGFDDQGSRFDGKGNLNNWWGKEDRERFDALGRRLVEQFSSYEPLPGEFINGELTLGENIGDLGGLGMAYQAYLRSLNGSEPPVIDGYTGYQRVFLGWAQAWRVKRRDELVRQMLRTGPHSPPEFRVNGVVINIDGFHQAFTTHLGDELYKPPEERIRIW